MNWEDFCYAECERQHATTPADISNMHVAFGFALGIAETPGIEMWEIQWLGLLADPIANPNGRFRTGPAVFMDGGSAAQSGEIEYRLTNLLNWLNTSGLTADEFYQTLMWIHPFKDGNGRVGALIYNVLNGTINNPVTPPVYR